MNTKSKLTNGKATVSLPVQPTTGVTTDPVPSSPSSEETKTSTDLAAIKEPGGPTLPRVTMNLPPDKKDKARPKKPKIIITTNSVSNTSSPLSEHSTSDVLREFYSSGKEMQKKPLSISPGLATSGVGDTSGALSFLINNEDDDEGIPESQESVQESQEKIKLSTEADTADGEQGKCYKFWKRTRGILLAVLASLQLSFTSYCAFVLHKKRYYSMPVLALTRFSGVFFFSSIIIPLFIHRQAQVVSTVCPMSTCERRMSVLRMFVSINFSNQFNMRLRAFIGSCSVVFQFYSLKHISPGDSSVILYCNPVFVAVGGRIFLNEKLSICACITAILAIIGVVIISKPPFLVGDDEYGSEHLWGLAFAFASMLSLTASTLLMRSLRHVHFSLLNSVFGLTGMITSVTLALAMGVLVRHAELETFDFVILFTIGVLSFGGICCMTLALSYEKAGPVSVARSSEVIFAFLWQMMSNIFPDALSLGGAALVMSCILLTGFYKYVGGLDSSHKLRRWFWFVLK